jgi:hypothetical protein
MESRLNRRGLFGLFAALPMLAAAAKAAPAVSDGIKHVVKDHGFAPDDVPQMRDVDPQEWLNRRQSALAAARAKPTTRWESHRSRITNEWSPPRG